MKRDVLVLKEHNLVIATDNCGSIGTKSLDEVVARNYDVAYFSARVVLMELLSVKVRPHTFIMHIFNSDDHDEYLRGVKKALHEVDLVNLKYLSSTESNFKMSQSAFSLTMLGKYLENEEKSSLYYGVLGKPLVGDEVLEEKSAIVPLKVFKMLLEDDNITTILPVGSKGILYEFTNNLAKKLVDCELDCLKSAGPSTCVIIGYQNENELRKEYKAIFTKINWEELNEK